MRRLETAIRSRRHFPIDRRRERYKEASERGFNEKWIGGEMTYP
jgi:hypothetical protein